MSGELTIEQYSEKAIVVRGNTQKFKENLKELGGKWNAGLRGGGGWIFPNSKKQKVEELNTKISSGEVSGENGKEEDNSESSSSNTYVLNTSKPTPQQLTMNINYDKVYVKIKDYLNLLSRVERLEQLLVENNLMKSVNTSSSSKTVEITIDSDEDEPEEKVERLLKKKVVKK